MINARRQAFDAEHPWITAGTPPDNEQGFSARRAFYLHTFLLANNGYGHLDPLLDLNLLWGRDAFNRALDRH